MYKLECTPHNICITLNRTDAIINNAPYVSYSCYVNNIVNGSCFKCMSLYAFVIIFSLSAHQIVTESQTVTNDLSLNEAIECLGTTMIITHNSRITRSNGLQLISDSNDINIFDYSYSVKLLTLLLGMHLNVDIYHFRRDVTRTLVLHIPAEKLSVLENSLYNFPIQYSLCMYRLGVFNFSLMIPHVVNRHNSSTHTNYKYRLFKAVRFCRGYYIPNNSFSKTTTLAISNKHNTFELIIISDMSSLDKSISLNIRTIMANTILAKLKDNIHRYYMPTLRDTRFRFIWKSDLSHAEIEDLIRDMRETFTIKRREFFSQLSLIHI